MPCNESLVFAVIALTGNYLPLPESCLLRFEARMTGMFLREGPRQPQVWGPKRTCLDRQCPSSDGKPEDGDLSSSQLKYVHLTESLAF